MTGHVIKKIIDIDASPEIVFNALIDPKDLTHWLPDVAILEPKVGGKFRFSFLKNSTRRSCDHQDGDSFSMGEIIELVKNKKLVYTWKWDGSTNFPQTTVTWELERLGTNKTRLTLTHSGFTGKESDRESAKNHDEGWSIHVNELAAYCKGK
ncbi:MAG: SRPBCC domain-containing protein [Thaumarchaeota archaeon]|nr:SRPBCC domain-containing protein [Nitrososphaerota archaeon]